MWQWIHKGLFPAGIVLVHSEAVKVHISKADFKGEYKRSNKFKPYYENSLLKLWVLKYTTKNSAYPCSVNLLSVW